MNNVVVTAVCGALLLIAIPGCNRTRTGGPKVAIDQSNKPKSTADLKARFEEFAKTGILGSAIAGIKPAIDELQDKKVAEELSKDLVKLQAARSPDEVKTVAKAMAEKLK